MKIIKHATQPLQTLGKLTEIIIGAMPLMLVVAMLKFCAFSAYKKHKQDHK